MNGNQSTIFSSFYQVQVFKRAGALRLALHRTAQKAKNPRCTQRGVFALNLDLAGGAA
ncbi:hypothetical protein [Paraburkholderia silvatlantica]|uniref:hypothetical protein n=1 Tax=Paraburkholderia silvatlantica TaxID=321895 RepID=UPI0037523DF3